MQNQPPDIIMTDYVAKAQSQAEAEQSAAPANQSSDIGSSIIPYKNPKALLGYYLGVFSILGYIPVIGIIGTIMGFAALALGIQALGYAKSNPEAKGKVHAWIAILAGGFFGLTSGLFNGLIITAMLSAHH